MPQSITTSHSSYLQCTAAPIIQQLEPRILLDATTPQGALAFATYLGGSGNDQATAIAIDSQDNILLTGYTYSQNSPTEDDWIANGNDTTYNGSADAFIIKLSPTGELIWSTYVGAASDDRAYDIAVDANDKIAITGYSTTSNWTDGGYDTTHSGDKDAFVAVYSSDGIPEWSTFLGESSTDIGYGVTFDSDGNLFVTGYTKSPGWAFDIAGAPQTHAGQNDGFIIKLSDTGQHIWSTYIGGSSFDFAQAVVVDAQNNVTVTGASQSPGWTSGGYDTTHDGQNDAFVIQYNADGQEQWSTYLGDSSNDFAYDLTTDSTDNILIVGYTQSDGWTDNTTGTGTELLGARDGYIVKLNSAGGHVWSTYIGNDLDDEAFAVATDSLDNILVTGRSYSEGWVADGYDTTHNGQRDAFLLKYDSDGYHFWSTFLGGSNDDHAPAVAVNSKDNIFIAGYTYSSGWAVDGIDTSFNGGTDAFVAGIIIKTIGGTLYADLNNNGQQDAGEYPLENWTIYIDEDEDGIFEPSDGEPSFLSDSLGHFYISDLDPITHKISLDDPTNDPFDVWTITDPLSIYYLVKITGDQAILNLDFGSNPQFAEFKGRVFTDVEDDNDEYDPTGDLDTPKDGWRVFIDLDGDHQWDEDVEQFGITDENGEYEILEVLPGEHHITVETPFGWQQTFPLGDPEDTLNNPYVITVDAGDKTNVNLNFGLFFYHGVVEGNTYNDLEGDAIKDPQDTGLLGWRVYADLNFNQIWDASEPFDLTDENGDYTIENLDPGTYLITAEINGFWQQMLPTDWQEPPTSIVFEQDFKADMTDTESLAGNFVLYDSDPDPDIEQYMVGHQTEYENDEYSYYQFKLNLTGYLDAQLKFDFTAELEDAFDFFNVQAATGSISPPDDLIDPTEQSPMQYQYQPSVQTRLELGESGYDGDGVLDSSSAIFDLTQFVGQTVTVRLQFGSDTKDTFPGISFDNISVTATPIERTANPPITTAIIRGQTTSEINFSQHKLPDGDFNDDGMVSLGDLDILGNNFQTGTSATKSTGDTNGDGLVTLFDLDILGQTYNLRGSQDSPSIDDIPQPAPEQASAPAPPPAYVMPSTQTANNISFDFHTLTEEDIKSTASILGL